jgi:hypothetical protein
MSSYGSPSLASSGSRVARTEFGAFTRQARGETVKLEAIGCQLSADSIYVDPTAAAPA